MENPLFALWLIPFCIAALNSGRRKEFSSAVLGASFFLSFLFFVIRSWILALDGQPVSAGLVGIWALIAVLALGVGLLLWLRQPVVLAIVALVSGFDALRHLLALIAAPALSQLSWLLGFGLGCFTCVRLLLIELRDRRHHLEGAAERVASPHEAGT